MSATYNHTYFNAPHILDRQHMAEERARNEAWEQYECQMITHKLVSKGSVLDYKLMTRKQAADENMRLRGYNSLAQWEVSEVQIETESEQELPF
jgi:galactose mutarotase-like enzyme